VGAGAARGKEGLLSLFPPPTKTHTLTGPPPRPAPPPPPPQQQQQQQRQLRIEQLREATRDDGPLSVLLSPPRPRDELVDGPAALAASSSSPTPGSASSSARGLGGGGGARATSPTPTTYYNAKLSSPPPSTAARQGIRGLRGGAVAAFAGEPAAAAAAASSSGAPTPPPASPAIGRVRTMAAGYVELPPEANPMARATSRAAGALAAGAGAGVGLSRPPEQRLASGEPLFFATPESLSYLDGALPGDYGFDPLGLFDPSVGDQRWLATAEVMNGRWAMVGVVLALLDDLLPAVASAVPGGGGKKAAAKAAATHLPWFSRLPRVEGILGGDEEEARALAELANSGAGGEGGGGAGADAMSAASPLVALLFAALVGAGETARLADLWRPGSVEVALGPLLPPNLRGAFEGAPPGVSSVPGGAAARAYPGGPVFNALNVVESPRALAALQVAEVKHGRVAMVAALAFIAQAAVTGEGPLYNLSAHLRSPFTENVLTQIARVKEVAAGME
jgi:light-harvesting complex I chlorophyll a/b binding protein 3